MVEDLTIQIFLTLYHGQLVANFFYDYIIRNTVRLFLYSPTWDTILNIALGVFFIAIIIWAILSVWGRVRRNLIISAIVLLVMFIIRVVIGSFEMKDKHRQLDRKTFTIEFVVFIAQMVVHLFGIIGTWLLSRKAL